MPSLVVLIVIAALLHYGAHVAVLPLVLFVLVLWVLWRLKWVILAIFGLEMLFGGRNDQL